MGPEERQQQADDPNARTIASYEAAADLYAQLWAPDDAGTVFAFIDAFTRVIAPGASVLEIGSGTGADADRLEGAGVMVRRSDATQAFVRRLRERGLEADVIDVLHDELGGPWDAVYANAVFLHLSRRELSDVLVRTAGAVTDGGVLAFTLKAGDGDEWTTARLGVPRHFTYWREPALREALSRSPWTVISITHATGARDHWLQCLCRRGHA